jgi:hypothetical protein
VLNGINSADFNAKQRMNIILWDSGQTFSDVDSPQAYPTTPDDPRREATCFATAFN